MVAQREPVDTGRDRVLDAFEEAVVEFGVQGASFARIAAAGGFHRSLVQHHFRTRQALVQACIERVVGRYLARVERHRREPPEQWLSSMVDWLFSPFGTGGPPRIARVVDAYIALAPSDPGVQAALRTLYAGFVEFIEAGIAVRAPGAPEADRHEVAFHLVALSFGRAGLDTLGMRTDDVGATRRAVGRLLAQVGLSAD